MSWTEVATKQFTMPIDFGGIISYGISEEEAVLDGLRGRVAGKNYMGYFIVSITSVDNIGAPYILSANEITVTPLITFTAECIRLTPQRVIADVIMGDKNIGKRKVETNGATVGATSGATNGATVGATSGATSGSTNGVTKSAEVSVIYTDKGAEFQAGTTWPTVISSVSHSAYSSKIIVTGSVLTPTPPIFYTHDGSKAASSRFIVEKKVPASEASTVIFGKLRTLYELPNLPGSVLSGDAAFDDKETTVYTMAGPMGPIHQLSGGDSVGAATPNEIIASAKKVNMYDVYGAMIDARNAIVYIADEYAASEEGKKRVAPYLSYVKNEMLRIKRLMGASKADK